MKNLKKILLLTITLGFMISCNRTQEVTKPKGNTFNLKSFAAAYYNGLNNEGKRILDDIIDYDYSVGVVDNPNFGGFSRLHADTDIYISGKANAGVKITIDGNLYTSNTSYVGGFHKQGLEFKQYFGKTVNVQIEDAGSTKSYSFYVPKHATAKKLGAPQSNQINRVGNTLEWQPDANSTTGKVALYYVLYKAGPNNDVEDGVMYKGDALLLDDNGQYSLDTLLADTQVIKINFILVTGNAVSFQTSDNKKLVFDIKSCDSHEYVVK